MQNSFTPVNASHADPWSHTLGLRARRTQRPSYFDDGYAHSFDTPEDSDTPVRQTGEPWEEEEEEIFREACKKHIFAENRKEAGPKVVEELRNRGFGRNIPTCAAKWRRMMRDREACETILGMRVGILWDSGTHRMRASDNKAQEAFMKNHPEYRRFFNKRRKWLTAELAMRAPPAAVEENDDIHNATPPPPPSTRKRGRPRKLCQSKGKEPETPAAERARKRTRNRSPSASYQPTNRSSVTLTDPFPSLSRSHSRSVVRQTREIDPLELLSDMDRQDRQAQRAVPLNSAFQASGSRPSNSAQYPPRTPIENAQPVEQQEEQPQQAARPAAPATNRRPRPRLLTPVAGTPQPPEQPREQQQEQQTQQQQEQQQHQPPETQSTKSIPPRSHAPMEQGRPRPQQEEQEPDIKREDSGTAQSPSQLSDDADNGELAEQVVEVDEVEVHAAVVVEDPYADDAQIIVAQIQADIRRMPDLTQEGRGAMYGCFANSEQGKFYILTAKHAIVAEHLVYVRDQLNRYWAKGGKNQGALFKIVKPRERSG